MSKEKTLPEEIEEEENPRYGGYFLEDVHGYGINRWDFEIFLDDIAEEVGVEHQITSRFLKNMTILKNIDPKEPVLIHMKVGGGDWREGMAIYDIIRSCPNPTTILSYTKAESMSSIILQAADKRVLMPNSLFMFHTTSLSFPEITPEQLENEAVWEKKEAKKMFLIYAKRLKQSKKFRRLTLAKIETALKEKIRGKIDVYLTAREAVAWGFADAVFHDNWNDLRANKKLPKRMFGA